MEYTCIEHSKEICNCFFIYWTNTASLEYIQTLLVFISIVCIRLPRNFACYTKYAWSNVRRYMTGVKNLVRFIQFYVESNVMFNQTFFVRFLCIYMAGEVVRPRSYIAGDCAFICVEYNRKNSSKNST